MTLKDRVKQYCDRKNMAVTKFERTAGLSNGYFKDNLKRMSDDKIESIHRAFPDINLDWLITGNGEMLKGEVQYVECEEVKEEKRMANVAMVSENDEIEVDLKGLMGECNISLKDIIYIVGEDIPSSGKLLPRHIMALQKRYGNDIVDKYAKYRNVVEAEIVESFPIVPEAVNVEPDTNIEEVIEEDGTELEAISPNLLLSNMKVNAVEQIKGTSMLPTIQPNDWVFIRFLKNKMKIVSGKTYYLNCKNRPTMIRRVKFEGEDKLRLIAKNSQYDDIVIRRSDIINIGNVVALFRMTFGDQYSELEELRREKDAEREKKDSQIDKMLEMMQAQGEQQSKLIDYITKQN